MALSQSIRELHPATASHRIALTCSALLGIEAVSSVWESAPVDLTTDRDSFSIDKTFDFLSLQCRQTAPSLFQSPVLGGVELIATGESGLNRLCRFVDPNGHSGMVCFENGTQESRSPRVWAGIHNGLRMIL